MIFNQTMPRTYNTGINTKKNAFLTNKKYVQQRFSHYVTLKKLKKSIFCYTPTRRPAEVLLTHKARAVVSDGNDKLIHEADPQ